MGEAGQEPALTRNRGRGDTPQVGTPTVRQAAPRNCRGLQGARRGIIAPPSFTGPLAQRKTSLHVPPIETPTHRTGRRHHSRPTGPNRLHLRRLHQLQHLQHRPLSGLARRLGGIDSHVRSRSFLPTHQAAPVSPTPGHASGSTSRNKKTKARHQQTRCEKNARTTEPRHGQRW